MGVVAACYNVAQMYAGGRGVAQSDVNARKFYEAGSLVGDPASKCNPRAELRQCTQLKLLYVVTLSVWLNLGKGGPVDKIKSFKLCEEAAIAGHIGAIFNLGVYYMSGQGTTVDFDKAAEYFQKAADRGVLHGAMNLGKMFFEGVGVKKDLVKAELVLRKFRDANDDSRQLYDAVKRELNQLSP